VNSFTNAGEAGREYGMPFRLKQSTHGAKAVGAAPSAVYEDECGHAAVLLTQRWRLRSTSPGERGRSCTPHLPYARSRQRGAPKRYRNEPECRAQPHPIHDFRVKCRCRALKSALCHAAPVEPEVVSRAKAAATSLGVGLGLSVADASVVHNSNKLSLRLLPCDVFARVAPVGQEVAAFEVELAQDLSALGSPVAALEPSVEACVYECDGFAVTFWSYYQSPTVGEVSPADYAHALARLHADMRRVRIAAPHVMDRVAEAEQLVANPAQTPGLAGADRELLTTTLQRVRHRIAGSGAAEQLLHGEPHPGNVLTTSHGPVFIDLETCCRGPIEFDLAHVPEEVSTHYPGTDEGLLHECRRLVLAMVAAWRWDARDEFPNGRQAGLDILTMLREGPPWPMPRGPSLGS
jgi:hypothetical protein